MIGRIWLGALFGFAAACGDAPSSSAQVASDALPVMDIENSNAWNIDYAQSTVTFRGTQEGSEFDGRFDEFEITVVLDPENLSDASIFAKIDLTSVDAGNDDRNQSLPTKDWFGVKQFPEAFFRSNTVTRDDNGDYIAAGELTIKGVSQPVNLVFTLDIADGVARAEGTARLNRTDFNIGEGAFADDKWVGYLVDVTVTISALSN